MIDHSVEGKSSKSKEVYGGGGGGEAHGGKKQYAFFPCKKHVGEETRMRMSQELVGKVNPPPS